VKKTRKVFKASVLLLVSIVTSPIRGFAVLLEVLCKVLPSNGEPDLHTQDMMHQSQSGGWHTIGAGRTVSPTAISLSKKKQ